MKFSIFSKRMCRTQIIRNWLRAFFHKWLRWRSYTIIAFMSFCNLTPLDGRFVNGIAFARSPKFVNTLPLYTFNIQFMNDNLDFSFLLWNKLHLYFVTFLLPVSLYPFVFPNLAKNNKYYWQLKLAGYTMKSAKEIRLRSTTCFCFAVGINVQAFYVFFFICYTEQSQDKATYNNAYSISAWTYSISLCST